MSDTWSPETGTSFQEETPMASTTTAPTVTVIGALKGGAKLVKAEWNGQTIQLSERTLKAIQSLGVTVDDNPDKYLF
jgi:hypothetical protein